MRDANTSPLHDGLNLSTATSPGHTQLRTVEPIDFTRYFILFGSSSVPVGPPSSSQELLLQGDQPVPEPPPKFATTTNTLTSASQLPPQPMTISSRTDVRLPLRNNQVVERLKRSCQTGHTLAEFADLDHGLKHWCTHHQYCPHPFHNNRVPSPRYGPTIPPLRPQTSSPQPPPMIDRHRRKTIRAPTLHLGDALE